MPAGSASPGCPGAALRVLLLGGVLAGAAAGAPPSGSPQSWVEDFGAGRLDPARWLRTAAGDFRRADVEVVAVPGGTGRDHRLRLLADTRDTRPETVKFLGVRSTRPFTIQRGTRLSVRLDWNDQANGSYLSAAIVLSPHPTLGNPLVTRDWLSVGYVGVPPGRSARMVIRVQRDGRQHTLYTGGWPERNRSGVRIGLQRIAIAFSEDGFRVSENGTLVYEGRSAAPLSEAAYLYLQLSSHSNYPARAVYFDEVRLTNAGVDARRDGRNGLCRDREMRNRDLGPPCARCSRIDGPGTDSVAFSPLASPAIEGTESLRPFDGARHLDWTYSAKELIGCT